MYQMLAIFELTHVVKNDWLIGASGMDAHHVL